MMSTDEDQLPDLDYFGDGNAALERQVAQLLSSNRDVIGVNEKLLAAILKISDQRDMFLQRDSRSIKVVRAMIAEMAALEQFDRTPDDPLAQSNLTNAQRARRRMVHEWEVRNREAIDEATT